MGLAANETGPAMWDLARAYADVQSSKSAQLIGATPSNPALSRRALAAQFDRINITPGNFACTLPKLFGTYFSTATFHQQIGRNLVTKKIQNLLHLTSSMESPTLPACSLLMVLSGSQMRKELAAHSVAKYGALARQKISTGNYITTLGEVTTWTHGRS